MNQESQEQTLRLKMREARFDNRCLCKDGSVVCIVWSEGRKLRSPTPRGCRSDFDVQGLLYAGGLRLLRARFRPVGGGDSSITGFFLYEPPDFEGEIDIEIFNDPSGKILFTTYADEQQTHTETKELSFNPTEDFHDYAFFYDEDSITFYVDGELIQEYEGGLPDRRMKLYLNSWFPTWLDGEKLSDESYTYVDWIEQ